MWNSGDGDVLNDEPSMEGRKEKTTIWGKLSSRAPARGAKKTSQVSFRRSGRPARWCHFKSKSRDGNHKHAILVVRIVNGICTAFRKG